ncbi:hypothetical protein [Flindersiella endophytica]
MLIAAGYLIAPTLGLLYGDDIRAAAGAELARQGLPATVLTAVGISFDESGYATVVPVLVALVTATLGVLNLAGRRPGWILSLVCQPLVLVGDLLILLTQVNRTRLLQSAIQQSGDPTVRKLDVPALLQAVESVYPSWEPVATGVRYAVVSLGSILVITLLARRPARDFFRKAS